MLYDTASNEKRKHLSVFRHGRIDLCLAKCYTSWVHSRMRQATCAGS